MRIEKLALIGGFVSWGAISFGLYKHLIFISEHKIVSGITACIMGSFELAISTIVFLILVKVAKESKN